MKKDFFLEEAKSLADYLINLTKDSNLPFDYTNLETNENFGNVMVDDLGDTLPFVSWIGKLSDQKYSGWAEEKSKFIVNNFQMPNGLLCTSFKKKKGFPQKNNFKIFNASLMSDSALGLNLMHDLTRDPLYKDALTNFFSGLKSMTSKKGFIYYKKMPLLSYPFSIGKYCGLYIEELAKLYEKTEDIGLIDFAKKLSHAWIKESFFRKNGLFPFNCTHPIIKPFSQPLFKKLTSFIFDTSMLTKSNTNLIFGLARLQKTIHDREINNALNYWVDAVESKLLTKDNILLSIWPESSSQKVSYLAADHSAIDALMEIYLLNSNKKALDLAIKITDGWLKFQSDKGLVIETPYLYDTTKFCKLMRNYSMTRTDISRLDSQVDFAIMILKIHELTGKKKYMDSAKKMINGIIKHHKFENGGFIEFVNVKTGEKKGKVLETKFLFLLIKLFMLFHEIGNGKKIYKNDFIKDIIRDR